MPLMLPKVDDLMPQAEELEFGEGEYSDLMGQEEELEVDEDTRLRDEMLAQGISELQKAEAYQNKNAERNRAAKLEWERLKNVP